MRIMTTMIAGILIVILRKLHLLRTISCNNVYPAGYRNELCASGGQYVTTHRNRIVQPGGHGATECELDGSRPASRLNPVGPLRSLGVTKLYMILRTFHWVRSRWSVGRCHNPVIQLKVAIVV